MPKNGAVILDVDGTLVDSNDAHAKAWVEAFAQFGITVPFDRVRRAIGMGGDKLMPAVAGIEEDSERGQAIGERRGEIFTRDFLPELKPFPCVRELIQRFAAEGFELAVASSAKKDELKQLLKIARVDDLIAVTTSSDDAEESKPAPDILEVALEKVGVKPQDALMLGDTPYDLKAARRAGIPFVGVECGGWTKRELEDALAVYADPEHLYRAFDRSPFVRAWANASTF
jgi:HAD superfamily hydrolase (TIGR01509 family)